MEASEGASARSIVLGCLGTALAALAVLVLHASFFEPGEWHVHGRFTDQAGYVTTAQGWLDEGDLRSGIVYPAFLAQPDWRPYMPGHYAVLAASFRLFGRSPFAAVLPSLLGYVVCAVGTFWIGQRLYDLRIGSLAALVFLAHPGVVAYAFTAMAELTFTTACVLAMVGFLVVPPQRRPWAMAPLLALPFLFRETGALLFLPMAALAWDASRKPWGLLLTGGASGALLFALNLWQTATGKGEVPLSWVTRRAFNYVNAFPAEEPELSLGGWLGAVGTNAAGNAIEIWEQLCSTPLAVQVVGFWITALLAAAALGLAWRGGRRDPFAIGAGALGLGFLALSFLLYDVKAHKGMRGMLFALPLVSVAGVAALAPHALRRVVGRPGRAVAGVLLGALAVADHFVLRAAATDLTRDDEKSAQAVARVREWGHDDRQLLMVDFRFSNDFIGYAVEAYPVPWSFLPVTDETFELLCERYTPGTMILRDSRQGSLLTREALDRAGLTFRGTFPWQGESLAVFQR